MLGFGYQSESLQSLPLSTPQYYLSLRGQHQGPYRADELRKIPGFTLQTPLRQTMNGEWKPAFTVIDLKAYFATAAMPNEWQAAAARVQKERTRLARKARWARLRFRVALFFRRLFYCTIGLSLAGAIGYGVHSGKFQPELWKARFTVMAHENIQLSISFLQHLDSRYFSPMKPVAVAKISVPPRQTLRPAVAAAFPKYQNPAYKRMQSYRRK